MNTMTQGFSNLSDRERNLCIAALDKAADDLIGGLQAAIRLGKDVPTEEITDAARDMRTLRTKFMRELNRRV